MSVLRICALFLTIGAATAKQYTDGFCAGVVDFSIDDSTITATKDLEAQVLFNNFPRWVPGNCLTALWKFACMTTYAPLAEDDEQYCRVSCMDTLDQCGKTLDLLGSAATPYSTLLNYQCLTSGSIALGCHPGGTVTYADMPENTGIVCPKPLGEAKPRDGTDMEVVDGTGCALPCPPLSFTHDEWYTMRGVGKWCSFASFILSAIVIFTHQEEKNLHIRLLNYGGALANGLLFTFLIVDDYEAQTCVDDVHYYKHAPFCMIQGVLTVGSYIWVFLWEACIAINLWITIVLQLKKNQQEAIRAKFLPVTAVCSVLAPAICLAGWNVGYDWAGYSGPVCLFLFTEEEGYYWALFFTPIMIICVASLVLMGHTLYRVNLVLSSGPAATNNSYQRFIKVLKYNRRMLLFIACYCILGCYQTGQILYDNLDSTSFHKAGEEYVRCLFENSISDHDPHAGIAACGDHPEERPAVWRTVMLITYASSIGILSFFVYGTQNKVSKQMTETINTILTTTRSERAVTAIRENDSSSGKKPHSGSDMGSIGPQRSPRAHESKSKAHSMSRLEYESENGLENTTL